MASLALSLSAVIALSLLLWVALSLRGSGTATLARKPEEYSVSSPIRRPKPIPGRSHGDQSYVLTQPRPHGEANPMPPRIGDGHKPKTDFSGPSPSYPNPVFPDGFRRHTPTPYELMEEIRARLTPMQRTDRCERTFGLGFLDSWNASSRELCPGGSSGFSCLDDLWQLRRASRPKNRGAFQCQGRNVTLNTAFLRSRVDCVPHRHVWICEPPKQFWDWEPGSIGLDCSPSSDLKNYGRFTIDHLQNFIHGIKQQEAPQSSSAPDLVIDKDVLLVSRENSEYTNTYHAMTDILNAFVVMAINRLDPNDVQLIFADEHGSGPFDPIWETFSGAGPLRSIDDYRRFGRIRVRNLHIVPAGYLSWLHGAENSDCTHETSIHEAYRRYVVGNLPLTPWADFPREGVLYAANPPSRFRKAITVVVRRPYPRMGGTFYPNRRWENPEHLLETMQRSFPSVIVRGVDLGLLNQTDQMSAVLHSDIFLGLHGAGMAYSLYVPPGKSVVEVQPTGSEWKCFNAICSLRALDYRVIRGHGHKGPVSPIDPREIVSQLKAMFPDLAS